MAIEVRKLLTRLTRGIRSKLRPGVGRAGQTGEPLDKIAGNVAGKVAGNVAGKVAGKVAGNVAGKVAGKFPRKVPRKIPRDDLELSPQALTAIATRVPTAKVELVPLDGLRYTQATVYHDLKDGRLISDLAAELKARGWDFAKAPPHMVRMPDGSIVTLDHRRLVAARQAGLKEVPALVHPWNEPLPVWEFRRYWIGQAEGFDDALLGVRYAYKQVARNWGEAVRFRSIEQRLRGYQDFPLGGSLRVPDLKGLQPRD